MFDHERHLVTRPLQLFMSLVMNHRTLFILGFIGLLGLFFGGPDLVHARSFKHAWDLGHIFIFAIWTVLLLRLWPWLKAVSFGTQTLVILLLCIFMGGGIEWVQGLIGRYPSADDLIRDLIGSLLALLFWFPKRFDLGRFWRHLLQILCIAALLIAFAPVPRSLVDEWSAWRQFPHLSDFEAPFELDRWSGDAELTIDHTHAWSGRAALRIDLGTDLYSGAALNYFPGNWLGWGHLTCHLYNPDATPIRLTFKITDRHHDVSGYRFEDRFNRSQDILPGWNRITIDLSDVVSAPDDREMDLTRITAFQLFSIRLPAPRTLYLDHLMLN